jgi:dienelactone hydrolase
MADQFAANGYYTLIPDLFNGDPVSLNMPEGFDFMAWLTTGSDGKNPHTVPFVDKIVEASIKYLQEEKKMIKIGAVGYCFVRKCCLKLSGLQY